MSTGCPTCGDTLQGVVCEVPDHGQKRDLMIDWCMDCLQAKRFTVSEPKAPTFNIPQMVGRWNATPGAVVHPDLQKAVDKTNALAHQEGGGHYKGMKIQPVEFIHANGIGYFEGNVIKYASRWRAKGGVEDLKKARHYIDLLIDLEGKAP